MDEVRELEGFRTCMLFQMEMEQRAVYNKDGLAMIAAETLGDIIRDRWPTVLEILSRIDDAKLYMTIHMYYVQAKTVEEIANTLHESQRTVLRRKKQWLEGMRRGDGPICQGVPERPDVKIRDEWNEMPSGDLYARAVQGIPPSLKEEQRRETDETEPH